MPLTFKPSILTPEELLKLPTSSTQNSSKNTSSKKNSSSSISGKSSGTKSNSFYGEYQRRTEQKKAQSSWGAQVSKQYYDKQEEKLQKKIKEEKNESAREKYRNQLQSLRDKANATLPGGLKGMEEYNKQEQEKDAKSRVTQAKRKLSRARSNFDPEKGIDRRSVAAYSKELQEAEENLKNPISSADWTLDRNSRYTIREAKRQYDRGTELIKQGREEEGRALQADAHLQAEYARMLSGYSGGSSGDLSIFSELDEMEELLMTDEGKKALRVAKRMYELGDETGNEELKNIAKEYG